MFEQSLVVLWTLLFFEREASMPPTELYCLLLLLAFAASGFQTEQREVRESNQSLLKAAAEGSIGQVESLLSRGASVNAKDGFGWTALRVATAENSEQAISSQGGRAGEGLEYLHSYLSDKWMQITTDGNKQFFGKCRLG